jgi:hypothetical protein
MPCTVTINLAAAVAIQQAYEDCRIDCQHGNVECSSCHPLQTCGTYGWHTCSSGTTGGSPITAPTVSGLGDACNWEYARHDQPSSVTIVELALLAQREQSN